MTRRSAGLAIAATLGSAVLWGSSFSVNDAGLRSVGPATFAFLRFALAGVVVLAVAAAAGRFRIGPARRASFWLLAGANALGFLLQYFAQTLTTPARTALFVNSTAFSVALFELVFFRRRLGWPRALAILVGTAGAALLVAGGDPRRALAGGRALGDVLALASGTAWAAYFVANQRALERDDPLLVTGWTFALSAAWLLPALALDAAPLRVATAGGALAVLYAGLFTTALAYGLWSFGLRRLRASASAVLLLVEILVAALVSLALGRESFGAVDAAGAALLVAAVVAMGVIAERDAAARAAVGGSAPQPPPRRSVEENEAQP